MSTIPYTQPACQRVLLATPTRMWVYYRRTDTILSHTDLRLYRATTQHTVLLMKTITMQLLLQFASLHQTGHDLQEDPTTRGSEPLNRIWDHWTSVLPTRGRRQPLENTGIHCDHGLRSRRACHEERTKNHWQGFHSLGYKKFQDFSRTPEASFHDPVIRQQCLNIKTNSY